MSTFLREKNAMFLDLVCHVESVQQRNHWFDTNGCFSHPFCRTHKQTTINGNKFPKKTWSKCTITAVRKCDSDTINLQTSRTVLSNVYKIHEQFLTVARSVQLVIWLCPPPSPAFPQANYIQDFRWNIQFRIFLLFYQMVLRKKIPIYIYYSDKPDPLQKQIKNYSSFQWECW